MTSAAPPPGDAARPGAGRRPGGGIPAGRWRERIIAAGWMVLVWNLFWGRFTVGNIIGGVVIATVVLLFFPLPPVTLDSRLRPVPLLYFLTRFLGELVSASIHVAWIAIRPGYRPRGAIIAVQLRVRTDLNLTLTSEVISLVPGTLIIDVDRQAGVLYVHVFDVRAPEDIEGSRRRIHEVERRLVRAFGSPAEVRLLAAADPSLRGAGS